MVIRRGSVLGLRRIGLKARCNEVSRFRAAVFLMDNVILLLCSRVVRENSERTDDEEMCYTRNVLIKCPGELITRDSKSL